MFIAEDYDGFRRGLAPIIIFSVAAGSSGTINGIVGFRAGWALGSALFIATALAVIVGVATGGAARAIILTRRHWGWAFLWARSLGARWGLLIGATPLIGWQC